MASMLVSKVYWLALFLHSRKVVGSSPPGWGLVVCSLHVLPMSEWVLSQYSGQRYTVSLFRLTDDFKLATGVNVIVKSCLSLCYPCERLGTYPGP